MIIALKKLIFKREEEIGIVNMHSVNGLQKCRAGKQYFAMKRISLSFNST
jgi:hypothetical protein